MKQKVPARYHSISGFARYRLVLGFAPILIVVILGLIAVVGYFIFKPSLPPSQPTPTPRQTFLEILEDQTADWETYTNYEVGFLLKYPNGWYLEKPSERLGPLNIDEVAIANWDFKTMLPEEAEVDPAIRLNIYTARTEITLSEYLKLQANYEERYFEENIEIANIPGTKIKSPGLGNNITVAFRTDGYIVSLFTIDSEASENLLDQILSTFKFIEMKGTETITPDISVWFSQVDDTKHLHVVIISKEVQDVPTTISLTNSVNNQKAGPFVLVSTKNVPDTTCPHLEAYGETYWTNNNIDMPSSFGEFSYDWRASIQTTSPVDIVRSVEIDKPLGVCESSAG